MRTRTRLECCSHFTYYIYLQSFIDKVLVLFTWEHLKVKFDVTLIVTGFMRVRSHNHIIT